MFTAVRLLFFLRLRRAIGLFEFRHDFIDGAGSGQARQIFQQYGEQIVVAIAILAV